MSDPHREETESVVMAYLADGTPPPASWVEHARGCALCRARVAEVERLLALLEVPDEAPVDTSRLVAAVAKEARRRFRARLWVKLVASAAVAAALAALAWPTAVKTTHPVAVTVGFVFFVFSPAIIFFLHQRSTAGGTHRVYKRLRGKWLSGVCRGLAEAYNIPVWLPRVVFLAAQVTPYVLIRNFGIGWSVRFVPVGIYLVLDFMLPIHPEDRPLLLRLRLRQWFREKLTKR